MAARKRWRKWLLRVGLVVLSVLAGALGFAYSYVTDSKTLATFIRQQAPRYLPGSLLEVGRVQIRPLLGQITLSHIRLVQPLDEKPFATGQVAWLNVKLDIPALLEGRYQPREIVIAQPVLRLRRRKDGSWNLERLLADPWPAPPLKSLPVLMINGGTVQLVDGDGPDASVMVLRDVSLRAEPVGPTGTFQFEATARGGPFDRVRLEGQANLKTGRVDLNSGELQGLTLTESFCRCLPAGALERFRALGLTAGEVDLGIQRLTYDPRAVQPPPARLSIRLRGGTLVHPELPDSLNQVEAVATLDGEILTIERAEGRNGKTTASVHGTVTLTDLAQGPLNLQVELFDLELDDRLRRNTEQYARLWEEYRPQGWINLRANIVRARPSDPVRFGLAVYCKDLGITFERFPYPLEHIHGTLVWEGPTVRVDLRTLVGGEWLAATGTVENPGDHAIVKLDFTSDAFPIDETLNNALPPDIRKVVAAFHPTGSVRGAAHLVRSPPELAGGPERVAISGEFDINPGSSMRWDGMPYLVRLQAGHLEFTPDRWVFTGLTGSNGAAAITASGEVAGTVVGRQAVRLNITADRLPFEQQLRDALPPEWQATWATLNPSGECRVEATVRAEPGEAAHYHLKVVPGREARVQLVLRPIEGDPSPPRIIQMPAMENVSGTFVFDDGTVTMSDVDFLFREAPIQVREGTVVLRDTGEFHLAVQDLLVTKLRLDSALQKIMPPVMAEFARRLGDDRTFYLHGNLGIGWSGKPGEPARCQWNRTTVVFDGNTIQTGLPLEHIQGQFSNVSGWSDGHGLGLEGVLDLDSVHIAGQQITQLHAPVKLEHGWARADKISARILGGTLVGAAAVSLDTTPRYNAKLQLQGADLKQFTRTLPGRQELRGLLSAEVNVSGQGHDLRSVTGGGWAQIDEGDLFKLPVALAWAKVSNFRPPTRTAFDFVRVDFRLEGGQAFLEPVKFTGDAISLSGRGEVELQGERQLDLRLSPVPGRGERRLPLVGDVVREASGRVFDLRVTGPIDNPTIKPEPLPDVLTRTSQAVRRIAERRNDRRDAPVDAVPSLP